MRKNSVYTVHPGFKMEESSLTNLKERTGKTLEDWVRIVKKSGPPTERERIVWLKEAHGIPTNYGCGSQNARMGEAARTPTIPMD